MRKRNVKQFLAKPQGRLENTDTNMTFSMSRETAARLKEIARAENTSLQQLLSIALDDWLARRSKSSKTKVAPSLL
jgi:hypothetical protein